MGGHHGCHYFEICALECGEGFLVFKGQPSSLESNILMCILEFGKPAYIITN